MTINQYWLSQNCQNFPETVSAWTSLTAGITWLTNTRRWSHFQLINRVELKAPTGKENLILDMSGSESIKLYTLVRKTSSNNNHSSHNLNHYRLRDPIIRSPRSRVVRWALTKSNNWPFWSTVDPLLDMYRCFVFFHNAFILLSIFQTNFMVFRLWFWVVLVLISEFTRLQ